MADEKIRVVGANIAEKATMIWNVADMLRGPFKPHEYGLVILPMTVVKRFHDCLLPTHDAVLNRYFMYFLRSMAYSNAFMDFSNGVRIRSSDFRNFSKLGVFSVLVPPVEEQREIADYLDRACAEIDALIDKKEAFVVEIEAYKKSLIFEHVTGKKEVVVQTQRLETVAANMQDWQSVLITYQCIRLLGQYIDGRVKLQKAKYLIEHELGIQTGIQ